MKRLPQNRIGRLRLLFILALACTTLSTSSRAGDRPIVIAHRGASGYLPEHTLEAAVMAHAMGADFIEQDIVLTRDDIPIVLHDIHLDTVTNVASKFPNRKREDGRYYAIDFTVSEIKTLSVNERVDLATSNAVYHERFPAGETPFKVPTLEEEIKLIRGLNKSTHRTVGLYVEIKSPAWHHEHEKDISRITLDTLAKYGYTSRTDPVFIQCFDAAETMRMRRQLGSNLKLIQLVGENDWEEAATDFDAMKTLVGMQEVAGYADGIGPWIPQVITKSDRGVAVITELVTWAHSAGLLVHPYTIRADSLPDFAGTVERLHQIVIDEAGVDGVFTDFPDLSRKYIAAR